MSLDIRFPLGLMFLLMGLVLAVFGLTSNSELYDRSLGINVNLYWGVVMFLFGGLMFVLALRGRAKKAASNSKKA